MAEEVGTGYVRLIPSARGFARAAAKELRKGLVGPAQEAGEEAGDEAGKGGGPGGEKFVGGFRAGVRSGMASIGDPTGGVLTERLSDAGEDAGVGFSRGFDDKVRDDISDAGRRSGQSFSARFGSGLRDGSNRFGGQLLGTLRKDLEISSTSLATGFSAHFVASVAAGLASGAAKMAHGLAAVAALIPAAVVAGVLAFGTLKLAVSGVGDALSAGLAGDTEAFEESLKGLAPAARDFANEVVGLKDRLDGLKAVVQQAFFQPLVDNVRPLADLYLPRLGEVMVRLSETFGQTGSAVASFLGVPEIADKVTVAFANAGEAVTNVASAASLLPQALLPLISVGASFLPQITDGLGTAALELTRFLQSAERTGQLREFIQGGLDKLRELWDTAKQLGRIFDNIAEVVAVALSSVGGIFAGLGVETGGLLDSFERLTASAAAFVRSAEGSETVSQIFSTLASVVSGSMGFLQRIAVLVGRVFGPIAPQIAELFEAVSNLKVAFIDALEPALVSIFGFVGRTVLPALTSFAELLTRNRPLLQGIGIAIATLLLPATISWAAATLAAMAPWLLLGAVIAGFAALVIVHFDTIKGAIEAAFNWVKDHWQLLLAILTGPIGIAVGIIVTHWDTIKGAAMAVFGWVQDHWQLLLGILTGPIVSAVSFIVSNLDSIVSFVTGLPGRIASAASGMWDGISDAFRSAINRIIGWWNNLRIPGFDLNINLPGPVPDIGFSWGGLSLPDIPTLHGGGMFRTALPGDEGLALLKDRETVLEPGAAMQPVVAPARSTVTLNLQGGDYHFAEWVRNMVRTRGRGDVQVMFGQS